MTEDEDQLRLLSIFHFIFGGLTAIISCLALIYMAVGLAIVTGKLPVGQGTPPPPAFMGWFFVGFAALGLLMGWSFAIGMIIAGIKLRQKRGYVFLHRDGRADLPELPDWHLPRGLHHRGPVPTVREVTVREREDQGTYLGQHLSFGLENGFRPTPRSTVIANRSITLARPATRRSTAGPSRRSSRSRLGRCRGASLGGRSRPRRARSEGHNGPAPSGRY